MMHLANPLRSPVWKCICGAATPKRGALLSGAPGGHNGLHIHCPSCGRVVAAFINPKETH